MLGIYHDIVIISSREKIFEALSTASGLEKWWTKSSEGKTGISERMQFYFSPEYDWEGKCIGFEKNKLIKWKMTRAMDDWMKTTLTFELIELEANKTLMRFTQEGWDQIDEHFRRCSYSWAMYFRCLKRYIEFEEFTPYENRTKS